MLSKGVKKNFFLISLNFLLITRFANFERNLLKKVAQLL